MAQRKIVMKPDKKIPLVAHDNKKRDLLEWAKFNRDLLAHHVVYATGTTGQVDAPAIRVTKGLRMIPASSAKASGPMAPPPK